MPVNCQEIIKAMEVMAPVRLAESWDNIGLLIGDPGQSVSRILLALDVTSELVKHAAEGGFNMIIAHHPLIFKPISCLRTDLPGGKIIADLIKNNIAVYAAHTNLDVCKGGVNDALAKKLALQNTEPLEYTKIDKLYKLAVYVPETHTNSVRKALADAGAGHIGNYSHCTFQTQGMGTFLPLGEAKPFLGTNGKIEFVNESKLETILPENLIEKIVSEMRKAHPYEEVAYDLYELKNVGERWGLGRIGYLPKTKNLLQFAEYVKEQLAVNTVRLVGDVTKPVHKVAICGGSGGDMVKSALIRQADVLLTGDVKYHDALEAAALDVALVDAGHFSTEIVVLDTVLEYLNKCTENLGWDILIKKYQSSKDVFTTI